jgi:protein SCO1/2
MRARVALVFTAVAVAAAVFAPGARGAGQPDARKALETSQAVIGRATGDFRFTDSTGRAVTLAQLRGKPLVVSFVYTGCFQACPVATRFLATAVDTARKALGEDGFRVVSIGFNQPFDSPQAMAAFARQSGIADPRWLFLSPEPSEVPALARAFGFSYEATPKGFDHVTQLTVVDAGGVIVRQVYGDSFELPMLVEPLKSLLAGEAARNFSVEGVWEKVKLYCTVYDPVTGGYRVDYSLFMEIFAGASTLIGIGWFIARELGRSRTA